jgi:NAD(P)-dependent dehydrogenase (short-subunit alcohol dehydrogenase family)
VLVNNAGIMNAGRPADGLEEQLNAGRLSAVALDEVRTVFDYQCVRHHCGHEGAAAAAARSARTAHRQHGELRRVAQAQLRPSQPAPSEVRDYAVSKAALNALTVAFAADLGSVGINGNSTDPGVTAAGLNNFLGTRSVEQAAP